jgi:transcriptional regulator with XRE-family HTH domain
VSGKPIEPIYQAIGARIRMIRETLGLQQAQLAERVGLQRTSVVNFEAGRQRILLDDVQKFATALGTTPKHLLKGIWW